MSFTDLYPGMADTGEPEPLDGAVIADCVEAWFQRFIGVTDPNDFALLTLWTLHTHLVVELYTTPRLQIDSTIYGSGKTTLLDHLSHLCLNPVQAATLSSPALIPRLLEQGPATILLDEVDRALAPDRPGVGELLGILNSGYRVGATRPVLVPVKGGGWEVRNMPTFAAVSMAGNSPRLPDDTKSRNLRVLLMPDLDGRIEDSDWELIAADAENLRELIAEWADTVRDTVRGMVVDLPAGCIGRSREKWRPLKRVAVAAGGRWPALADNLIAASLAEDAAEREAGLKALPPGMVLLSDLHSVWPSGENFVATRELVGHLVAANPEYWGLGSPYGKALTETRFAKLLVQASKVTSARPGGVGPRGFLRTQLAPVWHRLGIARLQPGVPGEAGVPGGDQPSTSTNENHNRVHRLDFDVTAPGEPGGNAVTSENNRVHQDRQPHRVETDTPPPAPASGMCWCGYPPPPGRSMHFDCERLAAEAQAEPETADK
jgi:hypothetical protein